MKLDLDLQSVAGLQADLALLSTREQRQVLRQGTRRGAQVLTRAVRNRAPRRTGRLKRNILAVSIKASASGAEAGVALRRDGKRNDNTNAYYFHMVEHGTVHMAARPFVRPAVDEVADDAAVQTLLGIGTQIDRVFSR